MFAYLQRCRLCGYSWSANPFEDPDDQCPHCQVQFAGRERVLVTCDTFMPCITEAWLMRYITDRIFEQRTPQQLADFMVETQQRLGLEPQTDLSVAVLSALQVREAWQQRQDGTRYRGPIAGIEQAARVVVIRDGHDQLYGIDCMAALLTGWRAAIGDS